MEELLHVYIISGNVRKLYISTKIVHKQAKKDTYIFFVQKKWLTLPS